MIHRSKTEHARLLRLVPTLREGMTTAEAMKVIAEHIERLHRTATRHEDPKRDEAVATGLDTFDFVGLSDPRLAA